MAEDGRHLIGLWRGLEMLDLLSRNPSGLPFGKLQEFLAGLPSPTLSRLLRAMNDAGWVSRSSTGHYSAGINFINAAKRLSGGINISETVAPFVERLALLSEESAAFAEFLKDGFVFRAKYEMPSSYHYIPLNSKNTSPINGFNIVSHAFQDVGDTGESKVSKRIRKERFYVGTEPGKGIRFLSPVFYGCDGSFAGVVGISKIDGSISDDEKNTYRKFVEKSALQISKSLSSFITGE
ncbi:MAG: hypothetical protein A2020_05025 [Lentisphaerae bacterium GWF2_45_14]|nr:MAG: hypothetical protein A2020_05025 [Lentisphaerae bacterium GWF2_45_14]